MPNTETSSNSGTIHETDLVLFKSSTIHGLGGFAKFVTPTVVNGRVYAPAAAEVMVYGLLPQEA